MRILINGCNGKMGQAIIALAAQNPNIAIVAGVDKCPDASINLFPVFKSIDNCEINFDVIIDFSRPDALPHLIDYATAHEVGIVVATTGMQSDDIARITAASSKIPIFFSANMSLGVNLITELCKRATTFLGNDYDIEIIEKHHNQKVDAPSGTALALADAINEALDSQMTYQHGRQGTETKRSKQEIGLHAIRGGTIVGEHQVLFIGHDEIIEISHVAQSRNVFAVGALRAAQFIHDKTCGLYSMKDMLNN